jgi:inhibitor of KinA
MLKMSLVGDTAIRVQWGEEFSTEINKEIRSFSLLLEKEKIQGVIEWIPAYTSITLFYDPYKISYGELKKKINQLHKKQYQFELPSPELIHIPTHYGGQVGPDLITVAEYNQLSVDEVIDIHSNSEYLIYMMGFTPGFPYLGRMSKEIATPRLNTPRAKIPPGSVGIAGEQTGIYSMETPGGWQLIGRTPLRLYDPYRDSPMLLKAGNYLKFMPISKEEYESIEVDVKAGRYKLKKEKIKRSAYFS